MTSLLLILSVSGCAESSPTDPLPPGAEAESKSSKVVWKHDGGFAGGMSGSAVALADVDGDGDSDAIVGAPGFAPVGGGQPGAVEIFLAQSGTLAGTPALRLVGRHPQAQLGQSVASAGDVNGDGSDELLLAAPGGDLPGAEGYVLVLGRAAAGLVVQVELPLGPNGGAVRVAAAGDVNGDGFDDVAVGQPEVGIAGIRTGRVCVFAGSPGGVKPTPLTCLYGKPEDPGFGTVVAAAGDINGDGLEDLYVGAPERAGVALVFPGTPNGVGEAPMFSVRGAAGFGSSFAALGDLDGNGADEFAIGSPEEPHRTLSRAGAIYVFGGAAVPIGGANPLAIARGGAGDARLGTSLVSADLDGDGTPELVVGGVPAALADAASGRIHVYAVSDQGRDLQAIDRRDGDGPFERFGQALAAGDVLGRAGVAEVLVGAPGASGAQVAEGRVELLSFDW